ncbi:MAG: L,D-transpeptidase family protein [Anaplasmataceae bacterium]|nr:L,D-transpeptidase family protein [Anaplasmataceae bacterium]
MIQHLPSSNDSERKEKDILHLHILKHHVPFKTALLSLGILVLVISLTFWWYGQTWSSTLILSGRDAALEPLVLGSWPALQNAEFFAEVKNRLLKEEVTFIEGDLTEKVLRVYKKGELVASVDILSTGREGSWWETPAGLYRVQSKAKSHFSTFGQVYMPWSLNFQGNFFIHGWPYHPDGTPVPPGYSGGCIRLSNEDAETIYNLVENGAPVLVREKDFESDGFTYEPVVPNIKAPNYLIADLKSNYVFAHRGKEEVKPIASVTKLMTALVATEYMNVERTVTITSDMLVPTSNPRLYVGQKISVLDLLRLLLEESSNEAAVALAKTYYGGERGFVSLMNSKAEAIGMKNARFVDSSGTGSQNVASTEDLFALAKYLYSNRRFVFSISKGVQTNAAYAKPLYSNTENYNIFTGQKDFVGGKTGLSTPAGGTALMVFEKTIHDTSRPVVMIILGSPQYEKETRALYSWFTTTY